MAATLFSALNALLIHSLTPVDADVGIRYGMEAVGLLTKNISYKPTRNVSLHKNHRAFDSVRVYNNPQLLLSVEADITLMAGALAAKHPGEPIHKDYVLDFYEEIAHRFPVTPGYFIHDEPETGSPQGDLNTSKFNLIWFTPSAGTSQHVAAPVAPSAVASLPVAPFVAAA